MKLTVHIKFVIINLGEFENLKINVFVSCIAFVSRSVSVKMLPDIFGQTGICIYTGLFCRYRRYSVSMSVAKTKWVCGNPSVHA